ncbi:MAG: DUF2298 domain-containing protein, partial [Acidobacteriales bacterium]|nr:DUF2298 domain-containing protein [Terriglobales bacterium]
LPTILSKRLTHSVTTVVLVLMLVLVVGRLFPRITRRSAARSDHEDSQSAALAEADRYVVTYTPATGFALLLVGLGLLLTLAPEFVYLRDNFGTRMNTVFKFYYQTWLMWSIAAAYGVYSVFAGTRLPSLAVRSVFAVVALVVVLLGLLTPILSIYQRMYIETGRIRGDEPGLTLDGGASFVRAGFISQDDYAATQCLGETVQGDDDVVVEAYGQSYWWGWGKTGTLTGIPILYNWPGHQGQWRGATMTEVAGSRQGDIDLLYSDPTWNSTQDIIDRYGIDFIFFGSRERSEYGADAEIKFRDRLEIVCNSGNSRYYRVGDVATVAG